jgi:hypothetical protein
MADKTAKINISGDPELVEEILKAMRRRPWLQLDGWCVVITADIDNTLEKAA